MPEQFQTQIKQNEFYLIPKFFKDVLIEFRFSLMPIKKFTFQFDLV